MNKLLKKVYKKLSQDAWYLDLGCGDGKDLEAMKEKGFNVVGIDLKRGQNIVGCKILPNKFDVISAFYVLHFLSKDESLEVFYNVKKNLKPHGYFLYDDFNGFTKEELADLFKTWEIKLLEKKNVFDWGHKRRRLPHLHKCVRLIVRKIT